MTMSSLCDGDIILYYEYLLLKFTVNTNIVYHLITYTIADLLNK